MKLPGVILAVGLSACVSSHEVRVDPIHMTVDVNLRVEDGADGVLGEGAPGDGAPDDGKPDAGDDGANEDRAVRSVPRRRARRAAPTSRRRRERTADDGHVSGPGRAMAE